MDSPGSPTINHGFDFNMMPSTDANANPLDRDDPGIFIYVFFAKICRILYVLWRGEGRGHAPSEKCELRQCLVQIGLE